MSYRVILFAILLLVSLLAQSRVIKHDIAKPIYWPDEIPVFNEKSEKYYLDKIEDKSILVMFWASWCTYCIDDIVSLDLLKKDFRKLPIEIIAISEDYQGVNVVKKLYSQKNIRHLSILHDYKFKLFNVLHLSNLPYTFLIDNNKRIVLEIEGPTKWHAQEIRELIVDNIPGNHVIPNNSYSTKLLKHTKNH